MEWIFLGFKVKNKPCLVLIWCCCGLNTSKIGLSTSKLGSTPQSQAPREVKAQQGLSFPAAMLQIQHKPGLTA